MTLAAEANRAELQRNKLAELGFDTTPTQVQHPQHPLLHARRVGNQVFVSGQVPFRDGAVITGKVGRTIGMHAAQDAAKRCAASCLLAALTQARRNERVVGVIRMRVYVNCAPGFTDTTGVANGAGSFLIDFLGEQGKHARTAIGVAELPLNAAVEIEMDLILGS